MKKARTAHPSSLSCALLTSPVLKMKCKSELFGAPTKCTVSICMCGGGGGIAQKRILKAKVTGT